MQLRPFIRIAFWLVPLILLLWWRAHTFAPDILESAGIRIWPVVQGRSEPLDCDEAAYGYMARRQVAGDLLYKDLTEYKPPGGYWFYAVAVAIGGADEMTIRLMVLPVIGMNCILIGCIIQVLSSRFAAFASMLLFILLSTDPYVFGNGSNLEHLMNLLLTASLASYLKYKRDEMQLKWLFMSGLFVGMAAMVKQVCLLGLLPMIIDQLMTRRMTLQSIRNQVVLATGFGLPIIMTISILAFQDNLRDAQADVIEYSRALAADTPPDAKAPPFFYRWLTGNADPRNGRLPWPFGRTDWLVWWGAGSWPIVVLCPLLAIAFLLKYRKLGLQDPSESRQGVNYSIILVLFWLSCWLMIIMPGLYWQHYYMLLAPPSALFVGYSAGQLIASFKQSANKSLKLKYSIGLIAISISLFATALIQTRDYLMVPAEQLTTKYKGGGQWVTLRLLSEEILARTSQFAEKPGLEVWGWQSPLLFYTGMDAPDRYFFTDPLMKAYFQKGHRLIGPRLDELMQSIREKRPGLIFCGDIPFAELQKYLQSEYLPSSLTPITPTGQGLFVRKDLYAAFHSAR